jgi:small subunit ribosomal protein S6
MRPYETVIIFVPELEDSVIESFVERVLDLIRTNGGSPGTVDRWGRRTLAYELKHRREGYYVVVEFGAEPRAVSELDRFLLLLDEVLRHKIVRLPEKAVGREPSAAPRRTTATTAATG